MSKLDNALMPFFDEDILKAPDWHPQQVEYNDTKDEIKKLILDEFKAAEYDPWAFAERIEKL